MLVLVDVGARSGIDERWAPYHQHLDVIGFDADKVECDRLNASKFPYKVRYLPHALGSSDGQKVELRICKKPGCSSLLEPNMEFCKDFPYGHNMEVVERRPMTLSRLDSVLDVQPDVLKIDTQGYELEILRGAGKLLDGTLAVELEVEFAPLYQDQPLFSELDTFMRSKGFDLIGIRRTFWRRNATQSAHGGQLVHGDALYVKHGLKPSEKSKLILAAYKQHDLLLHLHPEHRFASPPLHKRLLGALLGGMTTNREHRRWVDSIRPPAIDWHDPDFY